METENFKLEIWHDNFAIDPFKDWDCEPPITANFGRSGTKDYQIDKIRDAIESYFSFELFEKNKERLGEIFNHLLAFDIVEYEDEDDAYDDIKHSIYEIDVLKDLETLCNMVGIPCLLHNSKGYSQGDYATVLIALTDDWIDLVGAKKENSDVTLKATANLFDLWAWDGVYGFTLYEKVKFTKTYNDGITEESFEWNDIDVCGGFIGNDFTENGMADHLPKEVVEKLDDFDLSKINY